MTKPLAFTRAAVRRAIEGARSAGLEVRAVRIEPDGAIIVTSDPIVSPVATAVDDYDDPRAFDE